MIKLCTCQKHHLFTYDEEILDLFPNDPTPILDHMFLLPRFETKIDEHTITFSTSSDTDHSPVVSKTNSIRRWQRQICKYKGYHVFICQRRIRKPVGL